MPTINDISLKYLCHGCGACESLCPTDAISMEYLHRRHIPVLHDDKCIDCDICYKDCPGINLDLKREELSKTEGRYRSTYLGYYESIYVGHANDEQIRSNSSSGGVVTSILVYMLQKGMIDGVIVTHSDKCSFISSSSITNLSSNIINAQKSKYTSSNVASLLGKIDKNYKLAIVGLPCQIQGVSKIVARKKRLKKQLVLTIGLFCQGQHTRYFDEYLTSKLGEGFAKIETLSHRGPKWKGGFNVSYKNGNKYESGIFDLMGQVIMLGFFSLFRCSICHDFSGELCDVTVGDAWSMQLADKTDAGSSVVVTRSRRAETILKDMQKDDFVSLQNASYNNLINTKLHSFQQKRIDTIKVQAFLKKYVFHYLDINPNLKIKTENRLYSVLYSFNHVFSNSFFGFRLLRMLPMSWVLKYSDLLCQIRKRYQDNV